MSTPTPTPGALSAAPKEFYCQKCRIVFQANSGVHCGSEAVPFDLTKHGRDLISGSNAWHRVWHKWKDHPEVRKVADEWAESGNSSAAGILNDAITRISTHTARPDVDALVKALEAEAVEGETQARLFNSVDDSENANYRAKRAANLRTILARHAKGGATG